jgi:ribosomal protein S20
MNSANELENIKTKIKKLLALSKSDNENEATVALEKANKLIEQFGLDKESLHFETVCSKATKTYSKWRTLLSSNIAWLYGCYQYRKCETGTFVFTGESLDAFMAGEMFTYLHNTINRCAKKVIHKNAKYKFRQDFKYGMALRICIRIHELGDSCSWSPHRETKIEKAKNLIERSIKITTTEHKEIKLNRSAVNKGALYGDGVSLARQAGFTPVPQLN